MKSILLLAACAASITLSLGRTVSDTSRRSSNQDEVLTNLAAIKAATAKIEQCLADNEASMLLSTNTGSNYDQSISPASEVSEPITISQEKLSALIKAVYSRAIAGIKDPEAGTLVKQSMTEIAVLGEKIQLILNPNQIIANELASYFYRALKDSEVMQLKNMTSVATQASEDLIKEHRKHLKSKIYKEHIKQLKEMQGTLRTLAFERMSVMVYDQKKSKDETGNSYQISTTGKLLVNNFSKEFVKLGLKRRNAVNDDASLVVLGAETPIVKGSPEDDAVIYTLTILRSLSTSQMDLIPSGVGVNYMTLLRAGINLSLMNHAYYAVHGKKVFAATLKDGRYTFDKNAKPVHTLTDQELVVLSASVNHLLRTALKNCNFKSAALRPIRLILNAKLNLITDDATASDDQEVVGVSE